MENLAGVNRDLQEGLGGHRTLGTHALGGSGQGRGRDRHKNNFLDGHPLNSALHSYHICLIRNENRII